MKSSSHRLARILSFGLAGFASSGALLALAPVLAAIPSEALGAKNLSDMKALAAKVAELEAKLAYLSDRQQIHDVYLRYMRGFDRNDVELLRSAFWPDVQINYGSQSNSFDEFVFRHLNQHTAGLKSWGHLITNETAEITGDVAHVETYVTALWVPKDDKSFANGATIVGGRYIDRLDRRNGNWRIAVREFVPHFGTKTDTSFFGSSSKETKPRSDCAMGTWDKHDPSYLRPLKHRLNKEVGPPCAE